MKTLFGQNIHDSNYSRARDLEQEILDLLRSSSSGFTLNVISKRLSVPEKSIERCLFIIQTKGTIFLNGNGHWRLSSFVVKHA